MRYFPTGSGGAGTDTLVRGKYVRSTRFASLGAGTSGTVTLPSNSEVVLDDFGGTVDAIVTEISGGKPTQRSALTALGAVVSATFNSSGDWTLSAAPASYPVAIVYRVRQTLDDFDSTASDIWGEVDLIDPKVGSIGITIDGAGNVITTGVKGYLPVPYDCKITGWTIVADQSGSIVVDVWKDTYANFPPTVADTIAGSEKPTLSSAQKNQDVSLSSWTITCTAGDVLGFNVDSATTVTRVTVILHTMRV